MHVQKKSLILGSHYNSVWFEAPRLLQSCCNLQYIYRLYEKHHLTKQQLLKDHFRNNAM